GHRTLSASRVFGRVRDELGERGRVLCEPSALLCQLGHEPPSKRGLLPGCERRQGWLNSVGVLFPAQRLPRCCHDELHRFAPPTASILSPFICYLLEKMSDAFACSQAEGTEEDAFP